MTSTALSEYRCVDTLATVVQVVVVTTLVIVCARVLGSCTWSRAHAVTTCASPLQRLAPTRGTGMPSY